VKHLHLAPASLPRALVAIATVLAIGGCTTGAPDSSTPAAASSAPESAEPSPPANTAAGGPFVIEDAGLESIMPAGTYSSRLFDPALTLELGDGWFRRDSNGERALNLRRGPDGEDDLTFISGMDFLQCGTAPVVEDPDAQTIVDAFAASDMLDVDEIGDVPVGDRTGLGVRLAGGGEPVSDDDFVRSNEFGCIISIGDEAFPADSLWVMATPDSAMQLVFVDVDGTTVAIRGRAGADLDAMAELMLEVLESVALG
jgi:hypothetical protein